MSAERVILPTSFMQQQLWLAEQLMPGTSMHNILVANRFQRPLNIEALERTLNEIVRRHDSLRTTFTAVDGHPMQVIHPTLNLTLPIEDLHNLAGIDPQTEVRRIAREQTGKPFDLELPPLFRMILLRLGDTEHVLLVTMHHLISDGWSLDLIRREIALLYNAYAGGKPSPLPDLPIQYADFARGQREWLQGEVFRIQLEYWKRQLAGAPSALELPTDRSRPAVRTFKGAREFRLLPRSLTGALQALGQAEGVTPFMILLAAFKLLLHRYSGQEDIVVGSPIANRNRTELERIIGLFVNTLVLRTDLSGDPSFRELMKRVRETAAGAYSHQETPFERLVQELVPERRLSHTPLFQVMFVLGNSPMQGKRRRQRSAPLSDRPLSQGDDDIAKFDLTLYISDTDSGLETSFKYSTDLFEQATISRMLGHFETLLQGIVASPELRLSELPLLSSTERHQLLVAWNQTDRDFGEVRLLHRWFETQVGLTPDAVAVVFENDQLTYSELNDRANRLAHHLERLGVGPERMVGLCVERSTEMVVGLLGILKAGAAYVPLDPKYPKDRLAFMLDDTQATVLVTQQRLLGIMPATDARVVCLDAGWEMIAAEPPENPAVCIEPANLAYVLYTSGSTGRPKGVTVEHQQLWNYTAAILERLQLAPGLSFAMVQPLTVDSCLTSIFPALCTGGVLHVISEERAADAHYLAEYFQYHAVDCLKIAPSHLAALHTASVAQQIMPRQRLVIGGEASRWDWVSALPAVMPNGLVFNHYGPTEATVGVLTFSVEPDEQRQLYVTTPLGRPLANTQIYLLDRRGQPVPVGVPGEIYIGGANVARGYLNRPELTAEMFVPDTFRRGPDRRLYKTGDRARYLADGNLEFLSRIDDQVKIRGFRVELKEIEAVLRQHPDVRDALVLSRRDRTSDRLVAYIVGKATRASNAELRGFLGDHLPDYMVPTTIVHLEALPQTPHGKVDRQALPVAEPEALEQPGAYEPPGNRTQEILARLWAQVLRLEQVGIHDNFFELGGDSILAIQIIARAAQAGVHFTSGQLFQHQTIATLASVVGSVKSVNAEQGPVTGPVPLTPIQHRFFDQQHAEAHHYNQAFLLHMHGELDPALMAAAVQHLLSHHDAFRLRYVKGTTAWDQHCAGPDDRVRFAQHDLSDLSQPQQRKAIRAAAARLQTSLDLSDGPLLRVAYFDLGSGQSSRLLIIVHHLAVDEVSWRILIEDLHTAYGQLKRGEPVALPPKTTSFKYWAERLQKHAQSSELRRELAYWLNESRKPVPPLPVDYPAGRGLNTMATARTVLLSLTPEETYQLLGEVPRIYHTQINDILLAALGHALCRWNGSRSLLINLKGHGREDIFDDVDLSRTVGWFTSVFPVRLELGENTNPAEALESVKEQLRRVPRRGLGYGILRYLTSNNANEELKALKPEISFNYLDQFDQTLSTTSMLSAAQRAKSGGPAKIDTEADIRGSMRGGRASREHLLEITGSVLRDQLRLVCTYSEKVHRRPTIEGLLGATKEALQAILAHSQTLQNAVRTASDHPFELDHPTFDQLTSADPQIEQVYPLSPLQQGMLFHSVYAPGSRAYVGQYQRAFDSLNVECFKRAWARVVRRHPVLRTGFVWKGVAEPLQVVRREVRLSWEEHNWRGLSVSEREARLEAFRIADRQRGFDLS